MSAAKKRAGFSGDHPLLGVVVVVMLLLAVCSSFGLSAHGLWMLAGEMGVEGWARALLVLTIDGLIVGTTAAILIRRGRKEPTWFLWFVVFAMTTISAWANFAAHQLEGQALTPSIVGALMPVTLLAATEVTLLTLVRGEGEAPAPRPSKRAPIPTPAAAAVTAPTAAPTQVVAAPKPRPAARPVERVTGEAADLLREFAALASDPASSERGSDESARTSALLYSLVEDHRMRVSDLAREAGHPTPDRLKARLSAERKKRSALVDA